MAGQIHYGGADVAALQVTTGIYPSTGIPIDIRQCVETFDILRSNQPVGCMLYPGLQIFIKDTEEYVTVLSLKDGRDGTRWSDWNFDVILDAFKTDIDNAHEDIRYQGMVKTDTYNTQNLLNFLYLRGREIPLITHTLTINYIYEDLTPAHETYVETIAMGYQYNVVSPIIRGYQPDRPIVSGTMGNDDITVVVKYSIRKYTLSYYTDLGLYREYTDVEFMSSVPVPTNPTIHGGSFDHWEYDPSLETGDLMPASDVTATAVFTEPLEEFDVDVTINPSQSAGEVTGGGTYTEQSEVVLTAIPYEYYTFTSWIENSVTISTNTQFVIDHIDRDYNLVAQFSRQTTRIIVNVETTPNTDVGGSVTGAGYVSTGVEATLVATPETGYRFVGWYDADDTELGTDTTYRLTPLTTDDINLKARFIKQLTVSHNNIITNGQVTGYGTYDYGEDVTLTATPDSGCVFDNWTVGGQDYTQNPYVIQSITANTVIEASFHQVAIVKVLAWTDAEIVDLSSMTQQEINSYLSTIASDSDNYVEVRIDDTGEMYRKTFATMSNLYTSDNDYLLIALPHTFLTGDGNMSGNAIFYSNSMSVSEHGFVGEIPVIASATGTLTIGGTSYQYDIYETYNICDPSGTQTVFGNVVSGPTTTFATIWNDAIPMPEQSNNEP